MTESFHSVLVLWPMLLCMGNYHREPRLCCSFSNKKRFHQVTLKQRLFLWNSIYWITIQDMTHSRQHITATVRTSYYYPLTEVTDGTGLTAVSDYFWTFCLNCQTSSLTLRECSEWTHWLTVLTVIKHSLAISLFCDAGSITQKIQFQLKRVTPPTHISSYLLKQVWSQSILKTWHLNTTHKGSFVPKT